MTMGTVPAIYENPCPVLKISSLSTLMMSIVELFFLAVNQ